MKVLELVRESEAKKDCERRDACQRYRDLLFQQLDRPDSITSKDQTDFKVAMERAGKSLTDVATDVATLKELRRLQSIMGRGVKSTQRRQDAAAAIEKHNAETVRILEARKLEKGGLLSAQADAEGDFFNAQRAINEINEFRRVHGALIGDAPYLTMDDLG